jgi:hypothetical protein
MRPALLAICVLVAVTAPGCDDDESPSAQGPTTEPVAEPVGGGTGLPRERCRGAESPPNIVDVVSHGADCGAVEDAMAELRSVSTRFRIGDFECARVSGTSLGGTWECRGEASYFSFEFGD